MTILKAKARQTTAVERVSEGADVYVRALRDGTISFADFISVMCMEGRVFKIDVGSFTGPITFTAGAIVATTPDIAMLIPAGVCVIPIELSCHVEATGTALILETCAVAGANGSISTAGTAVTPVNYKTDSPNASVCAPTYTAITAVAATIKKNEFWRDGIPEARTKTTSGTVAAYDHPYNFRWSAKNAGAFPIIMPAGTLMVYGPSTQAGTGFWKVVWIELPVTAMS